MLVWRWGCTALGTVVCPLSPHTEQLLSPPLGPEREVNALLWGTDSDLHREVIEAPPALGRLEPRGLRRQRDCPGGPGSWRDHHDGDTRGRDRDKVPLQGHGCPSSLARVLLTAVPSEGRGPRPASAPTCAGSAERKKVLALGQGTGGRTWYGAAAAVGLGRAASGRASAFAARSN